MTTAMSAQKAKERPVIFGAESVRAILEGRKTQTRRVVKPQPGRDREAMLRYNRGEWPCPYGKAGERLWVREGWRWYGRIREPGNVEGGFEYRADGAHRKFADFADPQDAWEQFKAAAVNGAYHWRPSIHMPRWASRIRLELTTVRVERVKEISGFDAWAEGYPEPMDDATLMHFGGGKKCREWYRAAWDSLNAARGFSFESNPFVWVIEFKRVEAPTSSE